MKVTIAQLVACDILPTQARAFVDPLNVAMERFHIETRAQTAAFIAQAAHETSHKGVAFARLEENLYYTRPERVDELFSAVRDLEHAAKLCRNPKELANTVYSNRIGNGDYDSGDGWRYRGRGVFQLTGRSNYAAAGAALWRPYKDEPDLVAQPLDACMTAGWYWDSRKLNLLADIDGITRKINPAMAGADDRRQRFEIAVMALA